MQIKQKLKYMEKESNAFVRGRRKLPLAVTDEVRRKIMEALGLQTITAFNQRRRGVIEPKISEFRAIEAVFAEYGVSDIWGEE